jgi:cyclic-di-GMP-binding protein
MPSFDVVSEIDMHELTNAVDQANREINTRFDFKGTKSRVEQTERTLKLIAPTEFQVTQMQDIIYSKLSKRQIDVRCVDAGKITSNLAEAQQEIVIKQGIDKELAKKLVKIVKESKLKVQAAIQGEQVRITGKKRDDLQEAIAMLRTEKTIEIPIQFTNFRD